MRMSRMWIVVLVGWMLIASQALIGQPAKKYEEGKIYQHTLENGMTVLTMERHIAPLIFHQLTYKVGSRNEHLGITGISHVVEHMMFKGTKKYGKGEVSKSISKNSGVFNAFTMNDMTSYYEYLPATNIEMAFDIESDRMQNSNFDPAEFKSEIEVIIQERRMRSESSYSGIFHEMMNAVAFDSHPNRDPIIGWPADLKQVTREQAYQYYKTFYTPNNAFLVLVGDFETEKILALAKKYYGSISRGPAVPELIVNEVVQKGRKSVTLQHNDVTQPSFRMAFHVPTYADSDAAPLKIAGMILCERSRDSRLHKRLIEKERIATNAAGGMGMTKDPTLFQINVTVIADTNMQKAESIVWDEIKRMQTEPVTDRELQKVKNRYRYGQVTDYLKNADIGSRISRYEAYYGWQMLEAFDRQMMGVSREDIQHVMQKYFGSDLVTMGFLYPKGPKKPRSRQADEDTTSAESINRLFNSDDRYFFSGEVDILKAIKTQLQNPQIARPKQIAPLIRSTTLKNGIKVYTLENHLVPALFVGGLIETGNMPEANEGKQPGIASLLADVMNRGPESMTYEQFSERLAFVPFSFSVSGSYRSFSFQGYSLLNDKDEMLKVGVELLTRPALAEAEIEKLRPRHLLSARNRFNRTSLKAFYHMFNTIFREHPYSTSNSTVASIRIITHDDLARLHAKYFQPERLTLVLMGDMGHAELAALANRFFGQWKNTTSAPPVNSIPPVKELTNKEIKVFTDKDYAECTINIGFAPRNDIKPQEQEAVDVMNYILASSALTSRIGVELRDKQGLIYGIRSELWGPNDGIGYWKFNTKTGPKNTEKVITGIFKEIRKLLAEGVTDEEVKVAKERQLGLLPFYIETPDDIANRTFEMIREKQPLTTFDKKADRILSVSKDEVLRVAKKYFSLDRFIVVIDGPIEEHSLDHLLEKL
ncbi:MAG: pitrilysin family protein [bacterium]